MSSNFPLEYTFVQDYLRRIKEKKLNQTNYVLSGVLDQVTYAQNIGYIQALSDAEVIIEDLKSQFFPEYRTH
jgi:hypothetical protein